MLLPAGQRASGEWIDDILRARAEEKGLLARTPLAGEFPRQRVELVRGADLSLLVRARVAAGADALGDVLLGPHALTSKMETTASAGVVFSLLPMNSSSWELP